MTCLEITHTIDGIDCHSLSKIPPCALFWGKFKSHSLKYYQTDFDENWNLYLLEFNRELRQIVILWTNIYIFLILEQWNFSEIFHCSIIFRNYLSLTYMSIYLYWIHRKNIDIEVFRVLYQLMAFLLKCEFLWRAKKRGYFEFVWWSNTVLPNTWLKVYINTWTKFS